MVFKPEAVNVVADFTLAVENSEFIFIDFVEPKNVPVLEVFLQSVDDVAVFVLLPACVVVDDGKDGQFSAYQSDDVVICGGLNAHDLFLKTVFLKNRHFVFKDVLVILLQKLLVGEVYTELLKTILREVLEAEDVEDIDRLQLRILLVSVQRVLYFEDYELKYRIVDCLAQSVSISITSQSVKSLVRGLLEDYLLLRKQDLLKVFRGNPQIG